MWMFLLWWCVDDHLVEALQTPGLGHLPLWLPLIIAFAFSTSVSISAKRQAKKAESV